MAKFSELSAVTRLLVNYCKQATVTSITVQTLCSMMWEMYTGGGWTVRFGVSRWCADMSTRRCWDDDMCRVVRYQSSFHPYHVPTVEPQVVDDVVTILYTRHYLMSWEDYIVIRTSRTKLQHEYLSFFIRCLRKTLRNVYCIIPLVPAHCSHMGTAMKHPVPDRAKLSFVIFDI